MDGMIDALSTKMAQATSRRGFVIGILRSAVGAGLGICLASGTAYGLPAIPRGCGGLGVGGGNNPQNGQKGCAAPSGSPPGSTGATNCHWDVPGTTYGDSDKYGCRPRTGGGNPRPYCHSIGLSCGNAPLPPPQPPNYPPSGPPTCPSGMKDVGYWSCCCAPNFPNNGSPGSTLTICLDCDPNPSGTACICLKIMPDATQCGGNHTY